MPKQQQLLVAIDPSKQYHPALERVLNNAQLTAIKPKLHLYIAVDNSALNANISNDRLTTRLDDINRLIARVSKQGIECESELCWVAKWQEGMLQAAKRIEADLIAVTDHSNIDRKLLLPDSKWALLREARRPVLLVRANATAQRETVLAAINAQSIQHEKLNKKIIKYGRWLAETYGAEFHVVNAYKDNNQKMDVSHLQKLANVESHRIHSRQGNAVEIVAEIAQIIDADVVVLGTEARQSMMDSIRGNTSERLLHSLKQDILTLN